MNISVTTSPDDDVHGATGLKPKAHHHHIGVTRLHRASNPVSWNKSNYFYGLGALLRPEIFKRVGSGAEPTRRSFKYGCLLD